MRSYRMLLALLVALSADVEAARALQIDTRETVLSEYLVVGTVVWAHAESSSIVVRGSSLLGHLHVGVKSYRVKQPSALLDLRPGDAITAVFSKRDGMLHRLRRVQAPGKTDLQSRR